MRARVLVVEDQADNRRLLRDTLSSRGFEVLEAATGVAGVEAAARERPDVILMDLQMPEMDGYEATRRIKGDPACAAIPVIAVTSYALSGDEDKARAAGCDDYLSKPISPRVLLDKVQAWLEGDG